MRALVIEDNAVTAKTIELALASEGIICDCVNLGQEGLDLIKQHNYGIIILDLMLPDIDGYEVLVRLRSTKTKLPILILSGLSSSEQKIKGLGFGADDYMTKPFDRGELAARVHAIVRRYKGHSETAVHFGELTLNIDTRKVDVAGISVHLTNSEYAILELLAMNKGKVLPQEMFFNHLYKGIDEPDIKIINVFISKIRKKLSDASGGINYIETVWGRGYTMREQE